MAENKAIREFADRWNQKFRDPNTGEQELEAGFDRECAALGFQMDCGRAFQKAYGSSAFQDSGDLGKIIDSIEDEILLGSGIFSKFRYLTYWTTEDLSSEENRAWFCLALHRLAVLTGEDWKKTWRQQSQGAPDGVRKLMEKSLEDFCRLYPDD